jgi:rhodanese-related sulfurtransferase
MPIGALLGFAYGAACVALLAARFHHDVMRIFEARDRLHHRGSVLLDVDCCGDFVQRHPRVAVNIPLEELAKRAHELEPKSRSIVVYAHHLRDGMKAVHLLRSLGFQDVYDAAGVRVKEKLSAAAAHADEARTHWEQERGVPEDIELAPEDRELAPVAT